MYRRHTLRILPFFSVCLDAWKVFSFTAFDNICNTPSQFSSSTAYPMPSIIVQRNSPVSFLYVVYRFQLQSRVLQRPREARRLPGTHGDQPPRREGVRQRHACSYVSRWGESNVIRSNSCLWTEMSATHDPTSLVGVSQMLYGVLLFMKWNVVSSTLIFFIFIPKCTHTFS